jgi:undecaprenyl-diphosphatase
MVSMAFYGFLIYLINLKINNKKVKKIFIGIISIVILFIGFSRIYLGVHYTSDVIAGYLFSLGYLITYTQIIGKKLG